MVISKLAFTFFLITIFLLFVACVTGAAESIRDYNKIDPKPKYMTVVAGVTGIAMILAMGFILLAAGQALWRL